MFFVGRIWRFFCGVREEEVPVRYGRAYLVIKGVGALIFVGLGVWGFCTCWPWLAMVILPMLVMGGVWLMEVPFQWRGLRKRGEGPKRF